MSMTRVWKVKATENEEEDAGGVFNLFPDGDDY